MPDETHEKMQDFSLQGDVSEAEETTSEDRELYQRYAEQQRRLSCPGCGESEEFF